MEDLKDCSYQVKGSLSVKQGTVFNGDVPLMTFYAQSDSGIDVNAPCGKLWGKGGLLSFEGNAEESAKMFFEHVCKVNNEAVTAIAEQNRLLRDALEDTNLYNPCDYGAQLKAYDKAVEALALPDLSTSILNQRDARTLREAAEWFASDVEVISTDLVAKSLRTLAAEKEKQP